MTEDVEVVRRAAAGDGEAFAVLAERFRGMVFGYARATLRDPWLADDATQLALFAAYRNLASIRDPARFGAWLRGIVRYTCLQLMRDRASWAPLEAVDAAGVCPGTTGAEEARDSLAQVIAAIDALPDGERTVATLYYLQECSQREVAAFLGMTTSMVNNRLRSVRTRLRAQGVIPMTEPSDTGTSLKGAPGRVTAVTPGHIEAVFAPANRPKLLETVALTEGASAMGLVSQYLSDDVVRLLPLEPDVPLAIGDMLVPGVGIGPDQERATVPTAAIRALVAGLKQAASAAEPIETGIRAVDAFAPLVPGGTVAIVGDMHVGKLVLVEELLHRLDHATRLTIMVFLTAPDELGVVETVDLRRAGEIDVLYVPVADAGAAALADALDEVDTVICLSRAVGAAGIYPAIDAVMSRGPVPDEPAVARARQVLEAAHSLGEFVAQPFYVAEAFTQRLGITVSRKTALRDLERALA